MAGLELPPYSHYEDFPQLENGVGLVALLKYEFEQFLGEHLKATDMLMHDFGGKKRKVSIATGASAFQYIQDMAKTLERSYNRYNKLEVNVYPIKNEFFGEQVTVTGLLTGADLLKQLSGHTLGEELLLCRSMLKSDEQVFLDNMTVDMLADELKVKTIIVDNDGRDFIEKVTGISP
jgi:NifB/MoaA-like Fe-S oxidoreductase